MRRRAEIFLVVAAFLATGCSLDSVSLRSPRQFKAPPLVFDFPAVERFDTANGIRVFFREDRELPLVSVSVMISGGSLHDPDGKVGLAELFAATLRSGGAGPHSPDRLDDLLEQMGADFGVSADSYAVQMGLSLRREDFEQGLGILAEVLRRPLLDGTRLDLAKKRLAETIRRRDDVPRQLALERFRRHLYRGHPLGREPTLETAGSVSRSDLTAFHRRHFHPGNLWLAVSGDIGGSQLQQVLERSFGDWPPGPVTPTTPPPLPPAPDPELLLARRDLSQTAIVLGHLGIEKSAPDLFEVQVLDFILGGGGFNSRLMREIRSNRGLAYSVYSHFQIGRRLPGLFWVGCETRSDATIQVVELIRSLAEEMRQKPVAEEELRLAQESLINSFVFAFEDSHAVVSRAARLDFYGYPEDYLRSYRDHVAAVTAQGVLDAARRRLDPRGFSIVLVGKPEGFDAAPETLGLPVRELPAGSGTEGR
ncbi:MAG: insulinase family protein [Deltaproteobacteria bacterium]|nr:insulinase family protein [Deltaproteobacteria bacterium]